MFILKGYTKFFNSVQQKLGNHQRKFALTHHTINHPNRFQHISLRNVPIFFLILSQLTKIFLANYVVPVYLLLAHFTYC